MKSLELIDRSQFLGQEFALHLWMRGVAHGGQSLAEGDTSACFVDDSILLASEHGDVKRITLSKGNPAESVEAFEALARGMRPIKARVRLLDGDQEWVFTLTTATLGLSGIKLPPSAAKDQSSRLQDRTYLLERAYELLETRLAGFIRRRVDYAEALEAELREWIQSGLTAAVEA